MCSSDLMRPLEGSETVAILALSARALRLVVVVGACAGVALVGVAAGVVVAAVFVEALTVADEAATAGCGGGCVWTTWVADCADVARADLK